MATLCKVCLRAVYGRRDNIFCSIHCKNLYHIRRKVENKPVTTRVDKILHRNRVILLELTEEKKRTKLFFPKLLMEKMGFNFNHCTGIYQNNEGKHYHYVYDFAWMDFSKQDVMIVKQKLPVL